MPHRRRTRALCLALAVVGPLTLSRMFSRIPNRPKCDFKVKEGEAKGEESREGELGASPRLRKAASLALNAIGTHAQSIFSTVEWGTIKGLLSFLGGIDQCLEWLGASCEVAPEEIPYLKAGIEMLQRLDAEHSALLEDVSKLREELAAARERCAALSHQNAGLRCRVASAMEHERIIEQDRVQISALLDDKTRLQEENASLEREITALQELLQYAEERQRMAETTGPDDGDETVDGDDDGGDDEDGLSDDSLVERSD